MASFAQSAEAVGAVAVPEAAIPLMAAQAVGEHGKPIFGGLLIAISIIFIIIAIIVIAAAKTSNAKSAGRLMFFLFACVGAFGAYLVSRDKKTA